MAHAKPSGEGAPGLLRSGGDVPLPNEMLDFLDSLWWSPARTSIFWSDIPAMGELHDVDEANVAFPSFDAANVIAVQVGQLCQLFLGQLTRKP
jgi:hypothetical protein